MAAGNGIFFARKKWDFFFCNVFSRKKKNFSNITLFTEDKMDDDLYSIVCHQKVNGHLEHDEKLERHEQML